MTRRTVPALSVLTGFLLIFACGLLLAAEFARAQAPTEEQMLQASLPIAEAAFQQTDCAGRINVVLRADAELAQLSAYWQEPRGYAGYALPVGWRYPADWPFTAIPACTALIRSGLDPVTHCEVLSHEFAHLAGHQHDDADPLMNSRGELYYEPCVTGVAALTAVAAPAKPEVIKPAPERALTLAEELTQRVTDQLPKRFTWRVACKQLRTADQKRTRSWGTCKATAAGAKPRRFVADRWGVLHREDLRTKAARR